MRLPHDLGRLSAAVAGELRADMGTCELYASDASIYRRRPRAVLRAARGDDLAAALDVCRALGMPLTMRGAGTSLAGQTVGTGLVADCSALDAVRIDVDAREAEVGPGVVLDRLNALAGAHGLVFGPDVATADRATLGGMISNNSAGARSVVHGMTADHVVALDVLLADGTRATLRRGSIPPPALGACVPLAADWRGPALLRRASGYLLDALAGPDPDWPRVICAAEGTLAVILSARVRLVERPPARALALVPFTDVDGALRAVPDLLGTGPSAIELMDAAMLDPANRAGATAGLVGFAGDAAALLVVEYSGEPDAVRAAAEALDGARPVLDAPGQAAVWAVRRAGIARALRGEGFDAPVARDAKPVAIIEDPAVPPERVAGFAADVRRLLAEEGVPAVWYGHASVGCLHIRPLMDLRDPGAPARLRRMAEGVADLVVANGGSLSGEHGDGRARGELLPRMFPPRTMAAFRALRRALDPEGILNPGVGVDAEPLDAGLRLRASPPRGRHRTATSFAAEGGLGRAAEACNGNGACRKHAGTMCPSFQALGDERHVTRGRAVLFRAALEGRLPGGLADPALHEALELCLACKACAHECPASVDMARMKTEALAHRHRARGVPLGTRLRSRTPTLLALGGRTPALAALGARAASRVVGRRLPAPVSPWRPVGDAGEVDVVLFADTFTRHLEPDVGEAALAVLRHGGARVGVVARGCCGRPAMSEGRPGLARRSLRALLDALAPAAAAGVPVVVLEPSCWSMLRDDARHLLPDDPRVEWVAGAARSLEAHLAAGATPPLRALTGDVVTHAHCHSRALGDGAALDALLAEIPGVSARPSGAGCCGMAGAFGYRHPDVSRAIAADRLLPAVAGADVVVAPGTSCRHQVRELAGVRAVHPAQLLRDALA